jgi:predicted kinase
MNHLQKFQELYPDTREGMLKCTHHFDNDHLNPYHLEGDIWSHTMMVHKLAEDTDLVPKENFETISLATLFHDTGKVLSRGISDNHEHRINFHGHAGVSCFLAMEFMKGMGINKPSLVQDVIKVISFHHDFMWLLNEEVTPKRLKKLSNRFRMQPEIFNMILQHMKCDSLGRFMSAGGHETEKWMVRDLEKKLSFVVDAIKELGDLSPKTDKQPILNIMIGPPNSGKSTYAANNVFHESIGRDDIIMKLGGKEDYNDNWNSVDQREVDKVLKYETSLLIDLQENFTLDLCHMSAKSRRRSLSGIPKTYWKRAFVMMTPFSELFNRNFARTSKVISQNILIDMMKQFSFPTYDEFDEVRFIME